MAKALTPQQKEVILDNDLSSIVAISIRDRALHADFYSLYLKDTARYGHSFSAFIRDAMMCLLANGLDWRVTNRDNDKLDEILRAIQDLPVVEAGPDTIKEEAKEKALGTKEGFWIE